MPHGRRDLLSESCTDEEPHYGKYGMMRKTYLKRVSSGKCIHCICWNRLTEHLNVDDEAQERMDILVRQMMEKEGITKK